MTQSGVLPDLEEETAQSVAGTEEYHIGTPFFLLSGAASPDVKPEDREAVSEDFVITASNVRSDPKEYVPVAHVLKVIILGDASVGKTALIQRFVTGEYAPLPYKPTVGADFYSQKLELTSTKTGEKSLVTLQIWDTAGQERYRSLAASFYRGADVCMLVHDATRTASLTSVEAWRADFLTHAAPLDPDSFPFIFVRNKSDLATDATLNEHVIESLMDQFKVDKCQVLNVSAKSGENVELVFHTAAKLGVRRARASIATLKTAASAACQTAPPPRLINLNGTPPRPEDDDTCQC